MTPIEHLQFARSLAALAEWHYSRAIAGAAPPAGNAIAQPEKPDHETVAAAKQVITNNPGSAGKWIAQQIGVGDNHFRSHLSSKLKDSGFSNFRGRGWFAPPPADPAFAQHSRSIHQADKPRTE